MDRFNSPLDHVRIAAPCKADWKQMIGSDRVRFCGQCSLNVYNLSSMTKLEAESFIARSEGRLCVRFYRRSDGSILTENCPVGLRAIRRRLSSLAKAVSAAVLSFFAGLGFYETVSKIRVTTTATTGVIAVTMGDLVEEPRNAVITGTLGRPIIGYKKLDPLPGRLPSRGKKSQASPR